MGCVLGVCVTQVACCCCSSACSLCCACCPSSVTSIMTRLMYLFLIILGILASSVFLIPQVTELLAKDAGIPFYDATWCDLAGAGSQCEKFMGYTSVYRVWFGFVMFFLLMTIIMIGVKDSKDFRSGIQNGFWFFKILIIIALIVAAFFIKDKAFNTAWMYIGLIAGILFILFQVVFLVDFAHSWNEAWVSNAEDSKGWYVALAICMFLMYGLALAGVVGMFIYFTASDSCGFNKGIISVNIILCVVLSLIALLPKVQEENPRSGLLQASMITMYVVYLTFSALASEPTNNPDSNLYCSKNASNIKGAGNVMTVVGIIIAVLMLFYLSFKGSGGSSGASVADEEAPVQKVADDEEDGVAYNYSFFNFICMICCLYCMMVMTNWYKPETAQSLYDFSANWAAVWVQIVSSWVCVGLYIWTLVAPLCCPNRTFSWIATTDD